MWTLIVPGEGRRDELLKVRRQETRFLQVSTFSLED